MTYSLNHRSSHLGYFILELKFLFISSVVTVCISSGKPKPIFLAIVPFCLRMSIQLFDSFFLQSRLHIFLACITILAYLLSTNTSNYAFDLQSITNGYDLHPLLQRFVLHHYSMSQTNNMIFHTYTEVHVLY